MIAANFYKHTEALRFQREMFFNGYKNQPRFMRLMQCVFNQNPSSPDWWNAAKARARDLAKSVKKAIMPLFDERGNVTWTFKKIERLEDVELITRSEISRLKKNTWICTPEQLLKAGADQLACMIGIEYNRAKTIIQRLNEIINHSQNL